MFQKIHRSFFQKNLKRAGIYGQVEAYKHLHIVEQVLHERFGEGATLHAKPIYIKKRTVMIEIAHPAVGEEIRLQEESLISEINNRIGRSEILRVQFTTPRQKNKDGY
ncbi:MAG TPA: DciA family protein [Patescibacteria group bacterium]|nr:DciA family protein [Patescibacteria group bacterium]